MKVLKISVLVLVLSIIISSAGVFATNVKKYAGINIPSYWGSYETGTYYKGTKGVQSYENEYNINLCNGKMTNVKVKLTNEQGGSSEWMPVSNGATSEWGNTSITTAKGNYTLNIKNDSFTCSSEHSGNWYLEK